MISDEAVATLVVAGVGVLAASAGYFYRARVEKHQNLCEALYLLLEVWHRMTRVTYLQVDQAFDLLIARLRALHPEAVFSDTEVETWRAHFVPHLRSALTAQAHRELPELQADYQKLVKLIARSDPVYAYRVKSVSRMSERIAYIHQYLTCAFPMPGEAQPVMEDFVGRIKNAAISAVNEEETRDLERDLRGLALRVGIGTYLKVVVLILERRFKLARVSPAAVDDLIKTRLEPMIKDLLEQARSHGSTSEVAQHPTSGQHRPGELHPRQEQDSGRPPESRNWNTGQPSPHQQ